tara:strand:- start:227 stop:556 length:330 start_codon:yes stop_codon:yes gene_type:complete
MKLQKSVVILLGGFLTFEVWFMVRTPDKSLYFAFFGFISLFFFLYNILGISRTGEGTTGKGVGLYLELIYRMKNPKAMQRNVLLGFDFVNVFFLLTTVVNFILSWLFST